MRRLQRYREWPAEGASTTQETCLIVVTTFLIHVRMTDYSVVVCHSPFQHQEDLKYNRISTLRNNISLTIQTMYRKRLVSNGHQDLKMILISVFCLNFKIKTEDES